MRLSRRGDDAVRGRVVREHAVLMGGTQGTVFVAAVAVRRPRGDVRGTKAGVRAAAVVGTLDEGTLAASAEFGSFR